MRRATARTSWTRLGVGACCLLLLVPCASGDRRCPEARPISVGDTPVAGTATVTVAELPSPVAARIIPPEGYAVSAIVRTNFTAQHDVSDYLVFYDNSGTALAVADQRYRAAVVRWQEAAEAQVYAVYTAYTSPRKLADVYPGSAVYRHFGGTVYAKTVGYFREDCWENVIYWDGSRFIAERMDFRTADGFSHPVGPRYGTWPDLMPAVVTPDLPDGDGWYVALRFQENNHLGVDWNDDRFGDYDLGHPVFAAARGEVIYAGVPPDKSGAPNPAWNGVVVLRHRLVNDEDVFTLYGHLNVDPTARRADGSRIRVLGEVIRTSAPGSLDEVEKGQLIGYIGPKPAYPSTAPHLHFEVIADPEVAYDKRWWTGYRALHGDQTQWKDPTAFISAHRSFEGPFEIGQGAEDFGVAREAFQAAWERNQGPRLLGDPIGPLWWAGDLTFEGPVWVRQPFQSGELIQVLAGPREGQVFAVPNPLAAKFRSLFFRADPATGRLPGLDLGPPKEDLSAEPETSSEPHLTSFRYQNFEGGALELHLSGVYAGEAFEVHGEIFRRWRELGYARSPLGLPISDEKEAARSPVSGRTGRFSVFEGGVIHWIRETGRAHILGLNQRVGGQADVARRMADHYKDEGGSGGRLGFPVSDDYLWQDGVRCDFEGGYISWLPAEGVRTVLAAPVVPLRISRLDPSTVVGSSFTLTITGTGFDPGGAVDQVYKPDGSLMGQGQVKSRTSTQIVVIQQMAGAAPGNYTVKVKNPDSELSNGMTLRLVAQVSVAPPSGPAGTQFSYLGSGFTGNHGVTSHLRRPDGTEFSTRQISTSPSGHFSATIDSTALAAGTYQVWAVDNNTGISSNVVALGVNPGAVSPDMSVLAPVDGAFRVTALENPACVNVPSVWTFCQHQTGLHRPGRGLGGSDDTFAWDMNLLDDADNGKPVYAVAPGTVVKYSGLYAPGQTSGAVLIEHATDGTTWWSGYLHMRGISVAEGQPVDTSTRLGFISSVSSTGPLPNHLHFAVYRGRNEPSGLTSRTARFLQRQQASYLITTVAGNGTPGFSGDGGSAIRASLNTPAGIAVDASGNLYIADSRNNRIRKVSPAGIITTIAGNGTAGFSGDGGPAISARLNNPQGVAVDAAGSLHIADTGNYRIRRVTPGGTITTVAGSGEWDVFGPLFGAVGDGGPALKAPLNTPVDVAVDAAGNIFIADADLFMHRVRKVSPTGIITTAAGNGSLFFSGDGGPAVTAGLGSPVGIAVDRIGNLYMATGHQRIRKVTPGGIISTVAGSEQVGFRGDGGPATAASLSYPLDVAVDAAGNLYIADSCNRRIRRVDTDGTIRTIAGSGPASCYTPGGFAGDGGPATSALLDAPSSDAVDATGNIYVSDQRNHRIRKLSPIARDPP